MFKDIVYELKKLVCEFCDDTDYSNYIYCCVEDEVIKILNKRLC